MRLRPLLLAAAALASACAAQAVEDPRGPAPTTTPAGDPAAPAPPTGAPPSSPAPVMPTAPGTTPFEKLRRGVVGRWYGTARFGGDTTWTLWLDLHADGHYAVRGLGIHPGLYYGTDDDGPGKIYALTDMTKSMEGEGDVDFVGKPSEAWFERGLLRHVRLSSDGNRLTFELSLYAPSVLPITYDLRRWTGT